LADLNNARGSFNELWDEKINWALVSTRSRQLKDYLRMHVPISKFAQFYQIYEELKRLYPTQYETIFASRQDDLAELARRAGLNDDGDAPSVRRMEKNLVNALETHTRGYLDAISHSTDVASLEKIKFVWDHTLKTNVCNRFDADVREYDYVTTTRRGDAIYQNFFNSKIKAEYEKKMWKMVVGVHI